MDIFRYPWRVKKTQLGLKLDDETIGKIDSLRVRLTVPKEPSRQDIIRLAVDRLFASSETSQAIKRIIASTMKQMMKDRLERKIGKRFAKERE